MKRLFIALIMLLLLFGIAVSVQAADTNFNGGFSGLLGTEGIVAAEYQFFDSFGVKAGVRYDLNEKDTLVTGGFNFLIPFGSIKFAGDYERNLNGYDWSSYETSFRILMYENLYIYAGVRGDIGKDAPIYNYNKSGEPLLFIKADCNVRWPKIELNLQPLLYIHGYLLHNYSFKYNFNDRTALLININDLYDRQLKYEIGLEWKF